MLISPEPGSRRAAASAGQAFYTEIAMHPCNQSLAQCSLAQAILATKHAALHVKGLVVGSLVLPSNAGWAHPETNQALTCSDILSLLKYRGSRSNSILLVVELHIQNLCHVDLK
jgi:hypothetical protein